MREKRTTVEYTLHMSEKMMNNRKCLSEHPFGTVKRDLGGGYLLVKGKAKAAAEMSMLFLAYNLRRAINIKGARTLKASMA